MAPPIDARGLPGLASAQNDAGPGPVATSRALPLAALTALSLTTAGLLAAATVPLVPEAPIRLDAAVGVLVLAAGACAAAWTTAWMALTLCCIVAAQAGARRERLERVTLRLAPAVARRFVAAAIGATLAVGAMPAHAQDTIPVADVGWQVSSERAAPATDVGTAESPGLRPPAPSGRVASPPAPAAHELTSAPEPAGRATSRVPRSPGKATPADSSTRASESALATERVQHPVAGSREPTRASGSTQRRAAAEAPSGETVTVRAGDTLWALAASALGAHATDAAVAQEWPLWHDANRELLGDDPNLIRPGDVLSVPTVATRTSTIHPSNPHAARG